MQEITVKRLSTGTVYRVVFLDPLFGAVPFFSVCGLLGALGIVTVTWGDQQLTGLKAVVASPFIGLMFTITSTVLVGSAAAFGLWLYSKFFELRLEYE